MLDLPVQYADSLVVVTNWCNNRHVKPTTDDDDTNDKTFLRKENYIEFEDVGNDEEPLNDFWSEWRKIVSVI